MKVSLFMFLTLGLTQLALGRQSHYISTCNHLGWGYSEIITPGDRVPFCTKGEASIGADTLEKWLNERVSTQARQAFISGQWAACQLIHGKYEEVSYSKSFSFCKFPDNSVIEVETLSRGINNTFNAELKSLLL